MRCLRPARRSVRAGDTGSPSANDDRGAATCTASPRRDEPATRRRARWFVIPHRILGQRPSRLRPSGCPGPSRGRVVLLRRSEASPAVHRQPVDDQEVDREHRQRPPRIAGTRQLATYQRSGARAAASRVDHGRPIMIKRMPSEISPHPASTANTQNGAVRATRSAPAASPGAPIGIRSG